MPVVKQGGGAAETLLTHELFGEATPTGLVELRVALPGHIAHRDVPHDPTASSLLSGVDWPVTATALAGSTRPRTSPSEIHPAWPRVPHQPRTTTSSPSSSHALVVPSARRIGSRPLEVSSIKLPALRGSDPEIVPVANSSPVRVAAPLTVTWASCWAIDKYRPAAVEVLTRVPFSNSSSFTSSPRGSGTLRYGAG